MIIGQIELYHLELFALEFGKIAEYFFVYTLPSTNIDQSAPFLVKMYVTIRSLMRLIMNLNGPELSELLALKFAEIAESDFVYSLASKNVDQLVPNMVTIYMTIRSVRLWAKSGSNIWSYLPLNKEKMLNLTFFTL